MDIGWGAVGGVASGRVGTGERRVIRAAPHLLHPQRYLAEQPEVLPREGARECLEGLADRRHGGGGGVHASIDHALGGGGGEEESERRGAREGKGPARGCQGGCRTEVLLSRRPAPWRLGRCARVHRSCTARVGGSAGMEGVAGRVQGGGSKVVMVCKEAVRTRSGPEHIPASSSHPPKIWLLALHACTSFDS
jgi:hypothetical protein